MSAVRAGRSSAFGPFHRYMAWLLASSGLYVAVSAIGTVLAMARNRPAQPFGIRSGLGIPSDFVFGLGTALSAPLVVLVAFVAVMLGVWRTSNRRLLLALFAFAAAFFLGILVEPHTLRVLRDPGEELVVSATVGALIALPLSIAGATLRLLKTAPRAANQCLGDWR